MSHRIAVNLQLKHEYWGDTPPPFDWEFTETRDMDRLGIALKKGATGTAIIYVDDALALAEGTEVRLGVVANDPQALSLTQGYDWENIPFFRVAGGKKINLSTAQASALEPRKVGSRFAYVLSVEIPVSGTRDVTAQLEAVQALWTYFVLGADTDKGDLRIVDSDAHVEFEVLDEKTLPDGRPAQIRRSTSAITLRERSEKRLRLEQAQPAPFNPITLIPVLPTGGSNLRPVDDPDAAAPLQSDIYVSLW